MAKEKFNIRELEHPLYARQKNVWGKWRLTQEGGDDYLDTYLYKYSNSEEASDFNERKSISYVPAFAKEGVMEVKNSIYQRMMDIIRIGGTQSYQQAVNGLMNGVDLLGSSMNTFMGVEVLPELLFMSKVGIYVDMPERIGLTIAENINIRPYIYIYRTEDIINWVEDDRPNDNTFRMILLRDRVYETDPVTGLPIIEVERFRLYWKDDDGNVFVQFYDEDSKKIGPNGEIGMEAIQLNIPIIPFVIIDLGDSLLKDIANHQIALTNIASTDVQYCRSANFPFYTEQTDMRYEAPHLKQRTVTQQQSDTELGQLGLFNQNSDISIGTGKGRKYGKDLDRPGFIHPSSEPLRASMEKQLQLKDEIKHLLHLSISTLSSSAESKDRDARPLESGLSYIGLLLEDAERQIGKIWSIYENSNDFPNVNYPSKYSLKTDAERYSDADSLKKLIDATPSVTYKKEIAKRIAYILLATKIPIETLQKIEKEIDKAKVPIVFPELIEKHVQAGLLAPELAAELLNYPPETVAAAQEAQAKRLKLIREAQTPRQNGDNKDDGEMGNPAARGIPDESVNPNDEAAAEKELVQNK